MSQGDITNVLHVPATDEKQLLLLDGEGESEARSWLRTQGTLPARVLWVIWTAVVISACSLYNSVAPILSSRAPCLSGNELCPAHAFDNGEWVRKAQPPAHIINQTELLTVAGYEGCAGVSEGDWQWFGFGPRDYEAQLPRFSYEWREPEQCRLHRPNQLEKLQALVDRPLFVIGDSLQRQLLFQLSCDLYPHVTWRGTPWTGEPENPYEEQKWRASDQFLHLNAQSPLYAQLKLPSGFDIEAPLVSYMVVVLPLHWEEIKADLGDRFPWLHEGTTEHAWLGFLKPMNQSIAYFVDPVNRMSEAVFNVGAHFSQGSHFSNAPSSIDLLAIARWCIRKYLRELKRRMAPNQRFMIRATAPGLDVANAHEPVSEVQAPPALYNWQSMGDIQNILQAEMLLLNDDRFIWLGGDRISRLRPDARQPDGLHYRIGTGVMESVASYMWHHIVS